MSPVEQIRHDYQGAEDMVVLCDSIACTGNEGSVILANVHHGYGEKAPPISPEEEDAMYTVAFSHDEHHSLRIVRGHGKGLPLVNGVSQHREEDVTERKKIWEKEPHAPYPPDSPLHAVLYTYIAKSERPKTHKKFTEIVKEEFDVESRLFHILKDQFPDDRVEATRQKKNGKDLPRRKINAFFVHRDRDNYWKNVVFAVRFAYTESGIREARSGRKKVLATTANEWRTRKIVVLNGALEQENILADFIGQMANHQGKWETIETLQMYVGQFPDYAQQCFWNAMRKGFFAKRESLYSWVAGRGDGFRVTEPVLATLPGVETTAEEEASVLRT
jgi:hypothetical protein